MKAQIWNLQACFKSNWRFENSLINLCITSDYIYLFHSKKSEIIIPLKKTNQPKNKQAYKDRNKTRNNFLDQAFVEDSISHVILLTISNPLFSYHHHYMMSYSLMKQVATPFWSQRLTWKTWDTIRGWSEEMEKIYLPQMVYWSKLKCRGRSCSSNSLI